MVRDEWQSMLDHHTHNVKRATSTQLGVGMFGCEVTSNASYRLHLHWQIQQTLSQLFSIHLQKRIRRSW